MSKKQTAVSWLFEQLFKTPQYETEWQKLLEQAKQIEKEQIVDAYMIGQYCSLVNHSGEQYYSETYE